MNPEWRKKRMAAKSFARGMAWCCGAALVCVAACASAAGDASALLAAGKAAMEDELYGLASSKFEAHLKAGIPPGARVESTLLLAQAYHGLGRHAEMRALLEAGLGAAAGTGRAAEYEFWLAAADGALDAWDLALIRLDGFEENFPESRLRPAALRLRGAALLNTGWPEEAAAQFELFDRTYPGAPDAPENLLDLARARKEAGRPGGAQQTLERVAAMGAETRPGQEARLGLAELHVLARRWDEALEALAPLLEMKNVREDVRLSALFMRAGIEEGRTNRTEALALLDRGIEESTDPDLKNEARLRKGWLLIGMDKFDEGVRLIRETVSSMAANSEAGRIQLSLGHVLLERGLADKAAAEFQNYLETFSAPAGVVEALKGKGWALFKAGRFEEAAETFEKGAREAVSRADREECLFKAGDCLFANRQFARARQAYEALIRDAPGSPLAARAEFQAAECRAQAGETAEAERALAALARKEQGKPIALAALLRAAEMMFRQGKLAEAAEAYHIALAGTDEAGLRARALHGLGLIQYRLESFADALDDFERVVREYPDNPLAEQAYTMRGWCRYLMGEEDAALAIFDAFISRYPKSEKAPDVMFWIGEFHYNRGDFAEAERRLISLADQYPQSPLADSALYWAGRAAFMLKENRRANEHFARLMKQYPSSAKRPEARYAQGEAMYALGEFAGAILFYEELIKEFSGNALEYSALLRKGDSQFALGAENPKRYEEAMASFQAVLDRPDAPVALRGQAEYKLGRCLEKLGRLEPAFERYMNVVYAFAQAPAPASREAELWFTRAAFKAAELKEGEKSWKKAANIYQRVVDARVPAGLDAAERIRKIRSENWRFFY